MIASVVTALPRFWHILDSFLSGGYDSLLGLFNTDPPHLRKLPGIYFWCAVTCINLLEVHPRLVSFSKAELGNPIIKVYSRML